MTVRLRKKRTEDSAGAMHDILKTRSCKVFNIYLSINTSNTKKKKGVKLSVSSETLYKSTGDLML